jgi:CheY-like chemotaxis protein
MTTIRVLVAEDDEDHRYLTVRALNEVADVAIEIHEARDGQETLDYMYGKGAFEGRLLPHLVFLDLRMPKTNGLEVLARVKSDPELSSIPIVVVTSSAQREDIDRAYELGTNSYVTKARGHELRNNLARVAQYWTLRNELPGLAT